MEEQDGESDCDSCSDKSSSDEEHVDEDLEGLGDDEHKTISGWNRLGTKYEYSAASYDDETGIQVVPENLKALDNEDSLTKKDTSKSKTPKFTDDEYIIASPVVLGFALHDKLWLEFTVSGVEEIVWNEDAYDNLVLPPSHKDIVRSLVESHKFDATHNIDDIVQGKGK